MKKVKLIVLLCLVSAFLAVNSYMAFSYFFSSNYAYGLEQGLVRGYAIGFQQGITYENQRLFKEFIDNQDKICESFCERVLH